MKWPAGFCLALVLVAGGARAGAARCWFERGALVVPAAFGAIAGDFIVDLAAPRTQLHDTAARSFGLTGSAASADLAVAGVRQRGFPAEIVDLDARTHAFTTNIAGVLGADAFAPFVLDIAFSPCRLSLTRRPPAPPRDGLVLAVGRVAGVPSVRAAVSDGTASRWGVFAIATGDPGVGLVEARYAREPRPGAVAAGRLRALSLGGRLFEQLPATPGLAAPPGLDGQIGTAVWSRYRMRIDLPRRRLTLWPARGP